jgi:hypothetical protein
VTSLLQIDLLKWFIPIGFVSIIVWLIDYTLQARWWRNPVGLSIVLFSLLIAGLLVPFTLSLFFHLSRTTTRAVGWYDVVMIGLIPVAMVARVIVWRRYRASVSAEDDRYEGRGLSGHTAASDEQPIMTAESSRDQEE